MRPPERPPLRRGENQSSMALRVPQAAISAGDDQRACTGKWAGAVVFSARINGQSRRMPTSAARDDPIAQRLPKVAVSPGGDARHRGLVARHTAEQGRVRVVVDQAAGGKAAGTAQAELARSISTFDAAQKAMPPAANTPQSRLLPHLRSRRRETVRLSGVWELLRAARAGERASHGAGEASPRLR